MDNTQNVIRIYTRKPDETLLQNEELISSLPKSRQKKIFSMKRQDSAAQELAAGLLLKDILNVTDDSDLYIADSGKPYLADTIPSAPQDKHHVYFSLSHSSKLVVLAVADFNIGVDTENTEVLSERLQKRVFREDELAFAALSPENPVILWTRLEAGLKLSGIGVAGIDSRSYSLLKPSEDFYFLTSAEHGGIISAAANCPFVFEFPKEN